MYNVFANDVCCALCTCKPSTEGLLQALFFHFASSQADQLGPNWRHGLRKRQVLHTEGYCWHLAHLNQKKTKETLVYIIYIYMKYGLCMSFIQTLPYRFEMTQQTNSTGPHLMKLDSNASFRGDACDCSLSKLLVNDLTPQPETPINPSNHCQHCHQTANFRTLRVRKIILQETLELYTCIITIGRQLIL